MTKRPNTPNDAVREIAALQRKLADLLDEAGRRAQQLEIEMAEKTSALCEAITSAPRKDPIAGDVARSLAEHRVNVGELSSYLAEDLERRGHRVYPHRYEPIRAEWALVTNTHSD